MVFTIRDGMIVRPRHYYDTAACVSHQRRVWEVRLICDVVDLGYAGPVLAMLSRFTFSAIPSCCCTMYALGH